VTAIYAIPAFIAILAINLKCLFSCEKYSIIVNNKWKIYQITILEFSWKHINLYMGGCNLQIDLIAQIIPGKDLKK
jgi:hypothetical protein